MCSQSKWTLLHYAAQNGRLVLIDTLVGMGAIVDAQTSVSGDSAAAPPIDPHHQPLLPTCFVPTPTPCACVSSCPLAPSQLPLHGHQHLVDHPSGSGTLLGVALLLTTSSSTMLNCPWCPFLLLRAASQVYFHCDAAGMNTSLIGTFAAFV